MARIVGIAFICLFIQASTGGFTFGIFLPAMSADLGWSRSTIVVGSSLLSITAALSGPVLGRIVEKLDRERRDRYPSPASRE